jgi:hypothetical protein
MTGSPRIPPPASDAGVPKYGTPIDHAVAAFARSVRRDSDLDPRLAEIVRLRCARHHDCRLCRSLRTAGSGLDESAADKIDDYEGSDLDERAKAALRLTDAVIVDPRALTEQVAAGIRELLSPAEIAGILLHVVKFSQQKASVALRIEPAPRDGLSVLTVDGSGTAHVHAPAEPRE